MPEARLKMLEKRLVVVATEVYRYVVVADDPVAFRNVKFWSVEEPRTKSVPVAFRLLADILPWAKMEDEAWTTRSPTV